MGLRPLDPARGTRGRSRRDGLQRDFGEDRGVERHHPGGERLGLGLGRPHVPLGGDVQDDCHWDAVSGANRRPRRHRRDRYFRVRTRLAVRFRRNREDERQHGEGGGEGGVSHGVRKGNGVAPRSLQVVQNRGIPATIPRPSRVFRDDPSWTDAPSWAPALLHLPSMIAMIASILNLGTSPMP